MSVMQIVAGIEKFTLQRVRKTGSIKHELTMSVLADGKQSELSTRRHIRLTLELFYDLESEQIINYCLSQNCN